MSTHEVLRRFRLFAHFDDAHLERLAALGAPQLHAEGAEVLREGDPPTRLIVVLKGAFRVQRSTAFGPLTVGHVLPGDMLGDMGFVDGKAHGADAVAETDVEMLSFDTELLENHCSKDPGLAAAVLWTMWKSLSSKLRKANDQLAGFFGNGAEAQSLQAPPVSTTDDEAFQVGIQAKREIFQEQRLSSLEVKLLSSLSREHHYPSGEMIFHEGEPGDEMYVVLSGSVMISKYIPGAGEEALAFLERGDYFGEMALIDGSPRTAGAKAHDEGATVLAIPRDVVNGLLDIEKVSSTRLLRLLCSLVAQRVRESNEKLLGWFVLSSGQGS